MPDGIGRKKITGWINSETGEYVVRKPDQEGTWKPEIAWYWQQPFLQMSMKPESEDSPARNTNKAGKMCRTKRHNDSSLRDTSKRHGKRPQQQQK